MAERVLITGGTGLIGTRLTELLLGQGYEVAYLSRGPVKKEQVRVFNWKVEEGILPLEAIGYAHHIIHLAGAGVADKRWTEARKKEILESRTHSTQLLHRQLAAGTHSVKTFVSASAIGIYGADRGDELLTEASADGRDFLAQVTRAWENSVRPIAGLGIRTVVLRIGIVLSERGGALAKLVEPIRAGIGAPLGSGRQWMSWIHLDDLCRLFIHALENSQLTGVYNAVGPNPVTNDTLTRETAAVLGKKVLPLNAPAFALRVAFGEMAAVVLGSERVSNAKIAAAGFTYNYPALVPALKSLLQ